MSSNLLKSSHQIGLSILDLKVAEAGQTPLHDRRRLPEFNSKGLNAQLQEYP